MTGQGATWPHVVIAAGGVLFMLGVILAGTGALPDGAAVIALTLVAPTAAMTAGAVGLRRGSAYAATPLLVAGGLGLLGALATLVPAEATASIVSTATEGELAKGAYVIGAGLAVTAVLAVPALYVHATAAATAGAGAVTRWLSVGATASFLLGAALALASASPALVAGLWLAAILVGVSAAIALVLFTIRGRTGLPPVVA